MIKQSLLTHEEQAALREISNKAITLPGISKIIFFGSKRRGDFHQESDIDILIVLKDISFRDTAIKFLHDIELMYELPLSPVIFTEREYTINKKMKSRFIMNVEQEGIVLYDAQP